MQHVLTPDNMLDAVSKAPGAIRSGSVPLMHMVLLSNQDHRICFEMKSLQRDFQQSFIKLGSPYTPHVDFFGMHPAVQLQRLA